MAKMTPAQRRLVQKLDGTPVVYSNGEYMTVGGRSLHARTIKCMLSKGLLEPVGDALFPDCPSQTYRVAEHAQ